MRILVGQREGDARSESPQLAGASKGRRERPLHEFICLKCGGSVMLWLDEYSDGEIWASGDPKCPHCEAEFTGGTIAKKLSQHTIIKIFGP